MRTGARPFVIAQSMSTTAHGSPAGPATTVSRRAITLRYPVRRVVTVTVSPSGIGAITRASTARTSQATPFARYQSRGKPSASEWRQATSWT